MAHFRALGNPALTTLLREPSQGPNCTYGMKTLYFEYGGGLGDVFMQMYEGRSYNVLVEMGPQTHAQIVICCHNPHVTELFTHHPRRKQITLREIPYCVPSKADPLRAKFGLCRLDDRPLNPSQSVPAPLAFFPPNHEHSLIETLTREPFIVLSASAGERSRNIPPSVLQRITGILAPRRLRVVAVGRNYLRKNRLEQPIPSFPNLVNMVDKLSVPAVAQLVQRCIGTINCHSAISMLGWLENKPQLLLLDDKAWTRHFKKKDLWAFGADFETTTWVRSTQFHPRHLERFLELTCEKNDHFAPCHRLPELVTNGRRQE